MTVAVDISERQLKIMLIKLALTLTTVMALLAIGVSVLAGRGQSIAINLLLVCLAFGFVTNGFWAVLKIIDWFEARRGKRSAS
ncbi:hypothetical protein ACUXST_000887 [Sphingomonas sp. F9_3S_D5_B_2]